MKTIVFVTQSMIEKNMMKKDEYFGYMKKYLSDISKIKDIQLIIKLHPAEKHRKDYENIIKNIGINATILQKGHQYILEDSLKSADIVIGFKSSTVLMAMIMQKPVIGIGILDGIHDLDKYYYSKKEDSAIMKINKNADVSTAIKKLFITKNRDALIKKQNKYIDDFFYTTKDVYKNIAKVIEQLLKTNNKMTVLKGNSAICNIGAMPIKWFFDPAINRKMSPMNISNSASSFLFRKLLSLNEKTKIILSKTIDDFPVHDVMFLTFTPFISQNGDRYTENINITIRDKGIKTGYLVFDPFSKTASRKLGTLHTIYSYIGLLDKNPIKQHANKLANIMKTPEEKTYFSKNMLYIALLYYEAVRLALQKHKTKILFITGDSSIIERCAIAAADSCNVKVLINPIGLGFMIHDCPRQENIYMAVFGKDHKKMLMENGVKSDHIFLTGSIMFDKLGKYLKNNRI
ncbi:MAG: polysialyltransferase family glycosyltransferase [Candidatus Aenigmatarchaeota archaeon]